MLACQTEKCSLYSTNDTKFNIMQYFSCSKYFIAQFLSVYRNLYANVHMYVYFTFFLLGIYTVIKASLVYLLSHAYICTFIHVYVWMYVHTIVSKKFRKNIRFVQNFCGLV